MIDKLQQIPWSVFVKKWWLSAAMIPFIIYHLHQAYWVLRFNIFFSISYSFPFPINLENFLISNFLLIIHEAGHTFFGILGNRTLTILGGSLNELILPCILIGFFIINRYYKWTQFGFYFLGSAWLSIAFYAADAGERQLPLIGNLGSESHDWGNLLARWDLLEYDTQIAATMVAAGLLCYLTALVIPLFFYETEQVDLDLDL
ncbi:hypothetical protein [Rhodohalobacter mucosus]|uniref:Peptidase M50B-like protein n=1 Tax=Rhodohalobacter mucosus TaxID=2079485 RepID=A0A316TWS1_9BACT|nr:hypothetical protein [Rhodohalobacter mucosus]PWN07012.1 hypothetical protein DDZ15_07000 [Rhodohalobacter mucosus]